MTDAEILDALALKGARVLLDEIAEARSVAVEIKHRVEHAYSLGSASNKLQTLDEVLRDIYGMLDAHLPPRVMGEK